MIPERKNSVQILGLRNRLAWQWALGTKGSGELRVNKRPMAMADIGMEYLFEKSVNRPGDYVFAHKLLPAVRRRAKDYALAKVADPGLQALAELGADVSALRKGQNRL